MPAGARQWLVAGVVGRPHGLDGSFHVSDPRPELLDEGRELAVGDASARVARRAGTAQRPIVRLEGCDDRDAAQALRGLELRVARDRAPALAAGEWWAEELEGCRVVDGPRTLGVVRGLLGLPSCEALEVEGEGGELVLVPLVADAIRAVDPRARRIEVNLAFLGRDDGPPAPRDEPA